ncbi:MAG: hypothetical protein AAF449_14455 [Myxococcota bacterium]
MKWLVPVVLLIIAASVAAAVIVLRPAPMPDVSDVDWAEYQKGPTDDVRVYWVGHSLLNHRDRLIEDSLNAMDTVQMLAQSAGLKYDSFDHTHFGAPLSLLWNGRPHSYSWEVPQMRARRTELEQNGEAYNALVMTEGIPVHRTIDRGEFSAFYAQTFYCTLIKNNPKARVYVYESWNSYQALDRKSDYGPYYLWNWRKRLDADRPHWERIADLAATGEVPSPGLQDTINRFFGLGRPRACEPEQPIFLVPVGSVLAKLYDELQKPDAGSKWTLAPDVPLKPLHLFQNPYAEWPSGWPLTPSDPAPENPEGIVKALRRLHPGEEVDDVHPSQIGIYIVALTHFAVLYRRSPVGLATVEGISEDLAAQLQTLIWDVVQDDPRTGVK